MPEANLILKPASAYPSPGLRRMGAKLPPPYFSVGVRLTPRAAERLGKNPEVLLHHRLYNMPLLGRTFLYKVGGVPVCMVRSLDFFDMSGLGKPSRGEILVYAADERPRGGEAQEISLEADYPSPLLPFDLNVIKAVMEINSPPFLPGGLKRDQSDGIYLGAGPFTVYRAFHQLTRFPNSLQTRVRGIKKLVEVGSGLGIMSFIISCLLPSVAITGVELDTMLVVRSGRIKSFLGKMGYDFPSLAFRRGDLSVPDTVEIEKCDALVGFFPLTEGPDEWVIGVFQRLRERSLVFQLHHEQPLTAANAAQFGFRKIESLKYPQFPFHVFERV